MITKNIYIWSLNGYNFNILKQNVTDLPLNDIKYSVSLPKELNLISSFSQFQLQDDEKLNGKII